MPDEKAIEQIGGCLCGAVRYRMRGEAKRVVHCHCRMCRKSSGAAFMTFAAFPKAGFEFTVGAPTPYRSSASAVRSFCARCGSPLTFIFDDEPDTIWLTVGSLDQPDAISPTEHWYTANKVRWVDLDNHLPRYAAAAKD